MGLFNKSNRDLGSAAAGAQEQVGAAVEQVGMAVGQAQALAADGSAKYVELKDSAEAKMAEAQALKKQIEGDGPVLTKVQARQPL